MKDGVIADPAHCRFDPATMACRPGQAAGTCLTPAEAAAVRRAERGEIDPATGKPIYAPLPPGGESHWRLMLNLNPVSAAHFRYLVMRDPAWTPDRATDLMAVLARSGAPGAPGLEVNDSSPDLARFRAHGGKLIQYHGWSDEAMAAPFYPGLL